MRFTPIAAALAVMAGSSEAQPIDPAAVQIITDTARQICGEFQREGGSGGSSVSGAAEAKVKGLLGKLVDVGVEGAGQINSSEYTNVLREELGAEIKDTRRCNEKIWDDMKSLVLPASLGAAPAPTVPAPEPTRPVAPTSPDIAGDWTYVALCPDPYGYGQITVLGNIRMDAGSGGVHNGVVHSNLDESGKVSSTVSEDSVRSDIRWSTGRLSTAFGELSPDGNTWYVQDTDGCVAELTRAKRLGG